jgi:hypothetical protein
MFSLLRRERRKHDRFMCDKSAVLASSSPEERVSSGSEPTRVVGTVVNIGVGGCLFAPRKRQWFLRHRDLILTVAGKMVEVTAVRLSKAGIHCTFKRMLSERDVMDILGVKDEVPRTLVIKDDI